jgi:hypothetical protein
MASTNDIRASDATIMIHLNFDCSWLRASMVAVNGSVRQSTAVDAGCQQQRQQRGQWRLTVVVAIDGRRLQMAAAAIG